MSSTRTNIQSSKLFQDNLKNLRGTFAVERMTVSRETEKNLNKLAAGTTNCAELVEEIKRKYAQMV